MMELPFDPEGRITTNGVRLHSVGPDDDPDDWRGMLLYDNTKKMPKLKQHLGNVTIILRFHPLWRKCLQFDEHAFRVLVTGAPWHQEDAPTVASSDTVEWTDADSARLTTWITREVPTLEMAVSDCDRSVTIAAEANSCHPWREWLSGLTWDGVDRLPTWLPDFLGAEESEYTSLVGTWWLISAVARAFHPGCKADHVLILEGEQGIKKSTAFRTLAGERWFSDSPINIGDKDAFLSIQGLAIVELAELDALSRTETSRAKAFFSSPIDHYRPPYGKRMVKVPRGCVFGGSINPAKGGGYSYLTDESGNRRYWPVRCTKIDIDGLAKMREQIWAEAVVRFKRGERWWPEGTAEMTLCNGQQAERLEAEPWEELINDWLLANAGDVSMVDLLKGALKLEPKDINRAAQMRAARVLKERGYEQGGAVTTLDGRRSRVYRKP